MKNTRLHKFAFAAMAFMSTASIAAAQIRVVATTPDLAAIAREIGGSSVTVTALAKPTEDPHFVDAKPSHIVTLNRADVLIEGGAELELGWLPPLLESARNSKIVAADIAEHLSQVQPQSADAFKANLQRFNTAIDAKLAEWEKQLTPYHGA